MADSRSTPPSATAVRAHDVDADALLARLRPDDADEVGRLIRERDNLFLVHQALAEADAAETLEGRLHIFADAIRKIGFGRVAITLRDADLEPTLVVTAGAAPDDDGPLWGAHSGGEAWARWLPEFERHRVSHSYYLGERCDWSPAATAAGDAPGAPNATGAAGAVTEGTLIVPLRARDGRILATLVLGDPAGGEAPTLAHVRTVELFGQQMAHAIEQAGLVEVAERRAARLQRLQEVGARLARSLDEGEIVHELARQVLRLLPGDGVVVVRPDLEGGTMTTLLRVVRGVERPAVTTALGSGIVAEVARTGRPVRAADHAEAAGDGIVADSGMAASVLAVPMLAGIQLAGVIVVHAAPRGLYSAEDEELLVTVGAQAAVALVNARLYAESERERRQSEAFAEIARAVGGSLRLGEVLQLIMRHATALLSCRGACVALRADDYLHIVAGHGDAELLAGMHLPLGGSITGQAVLAGATTIVNDVAEHPDAYRPVQRVANLRNTVIAPLVAAGAAIGALSVINRAEDFTEGDARVLQRLADHVAVAIVNARLFGDLAEATREWAVAFDAMASGIAVVDGTGRVTRCNARAAELTDVAAPARLLGRDLLEALLQEPEAGDGPIARALGGAGVARATLRSAARGKVFDVVAAPHPNGGAVVTFDDVTVHHALAERAAQSEARYSRLVESAADAIFTVDRSGHFTSVNRALEIATGRRRDQLIGTPFVDLLDPRDREAMRRLFESTLRGARQRAELRYIGARGEERSASVTGAPIAEDGVIVGALGVVRDTTEERRLVEQLLQQEKLAAIGQLVSGVAHELNNPLAGVTAFAQILLSMPEMDGEQRNAAETIYQEARRAAKIVTNLLTFARQHQPERRPTDLNQVLLDTLELRRYAIRMAQVELDVDLDRELPLTWADPFQLQQVLLNLITNAEHALASWDGERRIALRTAHADGTITITVSDSGAGIAPQDLDRIFNPFYTTKGVGEGTGLGLSISDGIVREHGGRIRVESVLGEGARFLVELPYVDPLTMIRSHGAWEDDE
jgi:PAS domain S-box-containing protein